MMSRLLRLVLSVLLAVAVAVPAAPPAEAQGAQLHPRAPGHLPRKKQQNSTAVKTRARLAAVVRFLPRSGPEANHVAAKRSLSSRGKFASAFSSAGAGFPRVFRPLRC